MPKKLRLAYRLVSPFWIGTSLSILNYPTNFFNVVKSEKVTIHIEDIDHLSPKMVHLGNGDIINSDALICATGWRYRSPIKFLPEGIDEDLGLPYYSNRPDAEGLEADKEIFERYPRLAAQPILSPDLQTQAGEAMINRPFRLYRFMIPPNVKYDRKFAFSGAICNINTTITAELQALWIVAFFTNKMDSKLLRDANSTEARMRETIVTTQFLKRRYPGAYSQKYPDFVFDAIPYFDVLLKDLGLNRTRKSRLIGDIFSPYGVADYRGIVGEWQASLDAVSEY